MRTISEVTGLSYEDDDCVFFRNAKQSACYIEWGAKLIDVFPDSKRILVFVFSKADHEKFKLRWKNGE